MHCRARKGHSCALQSGVGPQLCSAECDRATAVHCRVGQGHSCALQSKTGPQLCAAEWGRATADLNESIHSVQVQMITGLIQQQDVGFAEGDLGKGHSALLPS